MRCTNTITDISSLDYDQELARHLAQQPGPRLLCVARFAEFKGQDVLIKAVSGIRDPDLRLFLVGDNSSSYGRQCRDLAASDPRIIFTDHVDLHRILAYYRACDLFILPNRFTSARVEGAESFGYAALEAAYMGLPLVLTTATGCSADLIREGVTGHTVAAGDPIVLQRCLEALLTRRSRLPDLGRAAALRAHEICAPTATADLESALARILEKPP